MSVLRCPYAKASAPHTYDAVKLMSFTSATLWSPALAEFSVPRNAFAFVQGTAQTLTRGGFHHTGGRVSSWVVTCVGRVLLLK
jgi:hypothetical protein